MQRVDRFCTGCGAALHVVADATDPVEVATSEPDAAAIADEPTESIPTMKRQMLPPPSAEASPTHPTASTTTPTVATTPTNPTVATDTRAGDQTELVPVIDGDDEWGADDPVWAPTVGVPAQPATTPSASGPSNDVPAGGFTANLPATEPITEVWMDSVDVPPEPPATTPYDFIEQEEPTGKTAAVAPTTTTEMPVTVVTAAATPGFRLGAVTLLAMLTGMVTLISLFANMVEVTSDQRLTPSEQTPFGFRTGTWIADDLADNLSVAGLLAIMLIIAGGVASGFRWRWGAGLAGGAGLAIAGLAGLTIGLAQFPIDAAHKFVLIPSDQRFTLTITRGLGYWLIIVAAALGVVVFFAAINDASGDRRRGLNPWIAALGALATVVAAAGPLLPEKQAIFSDNWYLIDGLGQAPSMLLVGRSLQLGLLLLAGVVGFLTVRRWGLGLAIGGSLPIIWLTMSTLFELTDTPVGPGFRNPGAADMHVHGVTIIGVSAVAAMAVLAMIAAYDQAARERP